MWPSTLCYNWLLMYNRYTAYTTASHTPQLTPTCTIKNIQSKHRQIHNRWNTVDKYGRQIRTQYVQTEVDGKLVRKCLCPHAQRNGQRENIAPLALSTGRVDAWEVVPKCNRSDVFDILCVRLSCSATQEWAIGRCQKWHYTPTHNFTWVAQ